MADGKALYTRVTPGLLVNTGAASCDRCGALVWSITIHDRWHSAEVEIRRQQ